MMMTSNDGDNDYDNDHDDDDDANDNVDNDDDTGGREAAPGARAEYRQLPARVSSLRSSRNFCISLFVFLYFFFSIFIFSIRFNQ